MHQHDTIALNDYPILNDSDITFTHEAFEKPFLILRKE
jgi:hypothetical protein